MEEIIIKIILIGVAKEQHYKEDVKQLTGMEKVNHFKLYQILDYSVISFHKLVSKGSKKVEIELLLFLLTLVSF